MATNDFQPFAYGGAANVVSQSAYLALTTILQNGFSSGVAQSAQLNKVWRQSSIMAAVLAQFSSDYSGQNSTDDGTTATLETNLIAAIRSVTKTGVILADTGAANAYTAVNVPPLVAGTWIDGVVQQVKIAHANTGASTYAPDGLTAIPIYGLGLQPLQGGELALNGTAVLMHATIAGVNGGNPICVLMECAGGAQQIPPATQSQHAVQLSQVGFQNIAVYEIIGGVQKVSVNGGAFTTTGATTFTVPASGRFKGRVWGAGGGSGSGVTSAAATGGAGGGYAEGVITGQTVGASLTITVGAGGTGGSGSGNGTAGGTSSIAALISCTGGAGGIGSSSGAASGASVSGGTATGGSLNISGQGPASAFSLGGTLVASGGGGTFGTSQSSISIGSATSAIFPGGAGSGGANNNVGVVGANGLVIIEY